jgi:uncharacterized protein YcbX
MGHVGRVESVWRYPVKSMGGEKLPSAFLGYAGVYGDRVYAFHSSAAHRRFPYLTAREREEMLLCRPVFLHPDRMAAPPNLAEAEAAPPGLTPVYGSAEDAALEVWLPSGERLAIDDPALAEWLGMGGREGQVLSLLHSHHAMTDCRPVSLFSVQTARRIGAETGFAVETRRFRANVVLDLRDEAGGDAPGFAEDGFVGRTLRIGERAMVAVLDRDPRCKMIALDPDTAAMDGAILKCVGQGHEGRAGVYGAVLVEGTVRPDDPVVCLDGTVNLSR